jgi:hypothetical protein
MLCTDVNDAYVFDNKEERRVYQMPLTGENFKRNNKLVYNNMLKAACVKSDTWTRIQDYDKNANGHKACQTLIAHNEWYYECFLLVNWNNGSSDWVTLKDLKDSYPIQIAEYAAANQFARDPPPHSSGGFTACFENGIALLPRRNRDI